MRDLLAVVGSGTIINRTERVVLYVFSFVAFHGLHPIIIIYQFLFIIIIGSFWLFSTHSEYDTTLPYAVPFFFFVLSILGVNVNCYCFPWICYASYNTYEYLVRD